MGFWNVTTKAAGHLEESWAVRALEFTIRAHISWFKVNLFDFFVFDWDLFCVLSLGLLHDWNVRIISRNIDLCLFFNCGFFYSDLRWLIKVLCLWVYFFLVYLFSIRITAFGDLSFKRLFGEYWQLFDISL